MAVNPTLAHDGASGALFPLPMSGETFLLKRDGIDFESILPRGGKLWGRGCFFLSTKRIVFVASDRACRQDFKSFEIPLPRLLSPKFNQPIFGANYLSGKVQPVDEAGPCGGGLPTWSLTFNSGGCGTFLPLFFQQMAELQEQAEQQSLATAAAEGRLNQVAFVDPSDPSVLYLSQPTAAPGSTQETPFVSEVPSAPPAEGAAPQGAVGGGNRSDCTTM